MPCELLTMYNELTITQVLCSGGFSCYGSTKKYACMGYAL